MKLKYLSLVLMSAALTACGGGGGGSSSSDNSLVQQPKTDTPKSAPVSLEEAKNAAFKVDPDTKRVSYTPDALRALLADRWSLPEDGQFGSSSGSSGIGTQGGISFKEEYTSNSNMGGSLYVVDPASIKHTMDSGKTESFIFGYQVPVLEVTKDKAIIASVVGEATRPESIAAEYRGFSYGMWSSGSERGSIVADMGAEVSLNNGQGNMELILANSVGSPIPNVSMDSLNMTERLTWDNAKGEFAANLSDGKVNAKFYGPNGEELGGTVQRQLNDNTSYNAAFGGKQVSADDYNSFTRWKEINF